MGSVIDGLLRRCAEVNDAALGDSTFGHGEALFVGKREIAHLDGPTTVDIRLTRAGIRERRDELREDPRVDLRRGQSDWLEFTVRTADDADAALALLTAAVEANRPTAPAGLPPTGSELERRRRFH